MNCCLPTRYFRGFRQSTIKRILITMVDGKLFNNFNWILLLLILVLAPGFSVAAPSKSKSSSKYQYVVDKLVINMRSGKSNEHRIVQTLESGAKLRILSRGKKYTKVRTGKGKTGWVLTRYLMSEPAARILLPPIKEQLTKLQAEHAEATKALKAITKERDSLKHAAANLDRLEKKHKKLLEESVRLKDAASKSTNLSEASKELSRKNATLESQLDLMLREVKDLREGSNRLWFLTGAGIILIGIVIGVIIARSRKEKKSTWGASTDSLLLR